MATIRDGFMGGFSGTLGPAVGATWRNQNVIKKRPKKSNRPPSLSQQFIRGKFTLVNHFTGRIDDFIKVGYQDNKGNMTGVNAAVRYHINHAVIGVYPDYTLDYPKIKLSDEKFEKIDPICNPVLTAAEDYKLVLAWELYPFPRGIDPATDKVYVLYYNVQKDAYLPMKDAVVRSALTLTITAPRSFVGNTVHGWAFFVSADGRKISSTVYLGQVIILE